jgi:hypothetical protein
VVWRGVEVVLVVDGDGDQVNYFRVPVNLWSRESEAKESRNCVNC